MIPFVRLPASGLARTTRPTSASQPAAYRPSRVLLALVCFTLNLAAVLWFVCSIQCLMDHSVIGAVLGLVNGLFCVWLFTNTIIEQ